MYGCERYLLHRGSKVAKKTDAWIQKELSSSQCDGCTDAHKVNNVLNICLKPKGNETDVMPLFTHREALSLSEPVRPGNPDNPGEADGANPG